MSTLRDPFPPGKIQSIKQAGVSLDYVGHADVTERLLDNDPAWTWAPVAFDVNGLPAFDADGGLWITLTVNGVTRYGYGEPQGRNAFDARKGAIGNAIRNAAMRFGVALHLWQKETPSHDDVVQSIANKARTQNAPPAARSQGMATEKQADAIIKICQRAGLQAPDDMATALSQLLHRVLGDPRAVAFSEVQDVFDAGPEGVKEAWNAAKGYVVTQLAPAAEDDPWAGVE
jgi:hypothetical protein